MPQAGPHECNKASSEELILLGAILQDGQSSRHFSCEALSMLSMYTLNLKRKISRVWWVVQDCNPSTLGDRRISNLSPAWAT